MNFKPPTAAKTPTQATATATAHPRRVDNVRLASASIVLTVFVLSFGDAIVKLVSADFSLWQLYVLRSLLAVPVLVALVKLPATPRPGPGQARGFMPVSLGWTTLRSFLMVVMWGIYFVALPHVAFSVAASVLYTIPLFITLFSALFTGDRVGAKSWFAVGFGFIGVLVIVRPTADDFNLYALLPLLSAILFACAMILTRTKCRDESPKILALMQNILFIITGGIVSIALAIWQPLELAQINPFLFGVWAPLGAAQWLAVAALAATVVIGNTCGAYAYQNGPSATIAAFDYTYLIFSLLWGFLLFTEIPDLQSVAGMAMIAASGLIIIRQPRR